ncbi:MAG: hypothetical protein AVDCRST_MAG58-1456 [uncultured Rubrobacteraceae bacterium]|uniref:Uncharacterized protein n=1 Tax=uncultured Rubrobacteraceae bacterium TaxID=349277 RepID=A0A6J4QZ34_9ACTN|nr:MAG: hypothetical protein AVDCRST_MAG58-1456 [uncultured Rubrobacteraceae bacterium]
MSTTGPSSACLSLRGQVAAGTALAVTSLTASLTTSTGIIFRELVGVLRRTVAPVYGLAVVVAVTFAIFPAPASAQGSDTVYDEAGALSGPEEQRV